MKRSQQIFKIIAQLIGHESLKKRTPEELKQSAAIIRMYINDLYKPTYKIIAITNLCRLGLSEPEATIVLNNILNSRGN